MENINLHLISRFVHCLAQSAEIYEEKGNQKGTFKINCDFHFLIMRIYLTLLHDAAMFYY